MKALKVVAVLICAGLLSACGAPDTATRNAPFLTKEEAMQTSPGPKLVEGSVHLVKTVVIVPPSLEVSEANSYYPGGDIVWREDPYGDRYAQVQSIVEEGLNKAAAKITGERPAVLYVEVKRFHALTQRARYTTGGVHNIELLWMLTDPVTARPLTKPKFIQANLDALGGRAAVAAEGRGITQRFRITSHLGEVFSKEINTAEGWSPERYGFFDMVNDIR